MYVNNNNITQKSVCFNGKSFLMSLPQKLLRSKPAEKTARESYAAATAAVSSIALGGFAVSMKKTETMSESDYYKYKDDIEERIYDYYGAGIIDCYQVEDILSRISKYNIMLLEKLLDNEDFPREYIAEIIGSVDKDNVVVAEQLCTDKDFPKELISNVIQFVNKNNAKFIGELCADKEFPREFLAKTIRFVYEDNAALTKKLCADKDFPKNLIADIISALNKDNASLAENLCYDKDFPKEYIAEIVRYVNKNNLSFAEKLCKEKEILIEQIPGIIMNTNKNNEAFARKLYENKSFRHRDKMAYILRHVKKENIPMAEVLCSDENLSSDDIVKILKETFAYNAKHKIKMYNRLTKSKNIPQPTAIDILLYTTPDNYKKLKSRCSNKEFINIINNCRNMDNSTEYILNNLCKLKSKDLKGMSDYINKIDKNKLEQVAPLIKDFEAKRLYQFYLWHYKKTGITDFTPEDLVFTDNFTKYLEDNYVDAEGLTQIITAYPNTNKNVGELPEGWLKNIAPQNRENVKNQVYQWINGFIHNIAFRQHLNRYIPHEIEMQLSSILQQNVKITYIGSGCSKNAYKISVSGTNDVVLGSFSSMAYDGSEGMGIEPQTGIFLNKHSNEMVKSVHMYFGRVAQIGDGDGFYVTQYIDDSVKPIKGEFDNKYYINALDSHDDNIIQGFLIDYGRISIYDRNMKRIENRLFDSV